MEFTINNIPFMLDEFQDGWAWVNEETEGAAFETATEAQQDALRWVGQRMTEEEERAECKAEERIYGTYEQQVNSLYYSTRL